MTVKFTMKSHLAESVRGLRAAMILLAAAFLAATTSVGQTSTGSLIGRVTDPSQAVILDATVSRFNNSTNQKLDVHSDQIGLYALSALPPGT